CGYGPLAMPVGERERGLRAREAARQRGERPAQPPSLTPARGVERPAAGPVLRERERSRDQDGVVLEAALRVPDSLPGVDAVDRGELHRDERGGRRGGREA